MLNSTVLEFSNQGKKSDPYYLSKILFSDPTAKQALGYISPVTGQGPKQVLSLKWILQRLPDNKRHSGLKINAEAKPGNTDFPFCWKDIFEIIKREEKNEAKSYWKQLGYQNIPSKTFCHILQDSPQEYHNKAGTGQMSPLNWRKFWNWFSKPKITKTRCKQKQEAAKQQPWHQRYRC